MQKKWIFNLTLLFLLSGFFLVSCNNLFGTKPQKGGEQEPVDQTVTMRTVIDKVDTELKNSSIGTTNEERAVIKAGAVASVGSTNLGLTDFENNIPLAIEGSVASIGSITGRDDTWRIGCVNAISAAYVRSLSGKLEATSSSGNMRAVTTQSETAISLGKLLTRISNAAVSNLKTTGITASRLGDAAAGIAATMIGSLDTGGVNKTLVNDAVSKITAAAVKGLVAAGVTGSEAMQLAVSSISEGAVTAVSSIKVAGIDSADYLSLAKTVTSSAVASALTLSSATEDLSNFANAATSGAAKGACALIKADASFTDEKAGALIQGVTSAAVTSALSSDQVSTSLDGVALVRGITNTASKVAVSGSSGTALNAATIYTEVTKGAAAAVTVAVAETGGSSADMLGAISLTDGSGTAVNVAQGDIGAGVAIGTNTAPVASAGSDRTVEAGTLVTLDTTESTDVDGDELIFAWSLDVRPTTSQATITPSANGTTASFTPEVVGTYIISLIVTDTKGAYDEALLTVMVVGNVSSTTWNGKTAPDRLSLALTNENNGDLDKARDEYLAILAHYPVSDFHADATFRLGRVYANMEKNKLGELRYTETIATWPESTAAYQAHLQLGWLTMQNDDDAVLSKTHFNAVITDKPGTALEAEAKLGLGVIEMEQGKFAEAKLLILAARDHLEAEVQIRASAQQILGDLTSRTDNLKAGVNLMLEVLSNPKYNREDPNDPATEVPGILFQCEFNLGKRMLDIGGDYVEPGLSRLSGIIDNAKYGPEMKLKAARRIAEYWLWNNDPTKAHAKTARDILTTALTANTGTSVPVRRERGQAFRVLGSAYQRLYDFTNNGSEREGYVAGAIDAWKEGAAGQASWWGAVNAAHCAVESASTYMWQIRDYTKTESILLDTIARYPVDQDQWAKAFAYTRLGQVYREMGYEAKNKYGKDPDFYFEKAISASGRSRASLFPSVDPHSWFFAEARESEGLSYAELGRYTEARSILSTFVADTNADLNARARAQRSIGRTYAREAEQEASDGNFDQALIIAAIGKTEYEKAFNFVDDNGAKVDSGRVAAEALFDIGQMYTEIGWRMNDHGYRDSNSTRATLIETFGKAEAAYLRITDTEFAELLIADIQCWPLVDRWRGLATVRMEMEKYAEARTSIAEWISRIDLEEIGEDQRANALASRGNTWKREVDNTSLYDQNDNLVLVTRTDLLSKLNFAITDLKAAIACNKTLDGGQSAAWALENLGWAYNRLNDGGFFDTREEQLTTVEANITTYLSKFNATDAFTDGNGNPVSDTNLKTSAQNALAHLYSGYAWTLRYRDTPTSDSWKDAWKIASDNAIESWTALINDPDSEPWHVIDAKESLAREYFHRISVSPEMMAENFVILRDLTESIIGDPESSAEKIAHALEQLGWAYLSYGYDLVGLVADIDSDSDWKTAATFYFNLVLSTPTYQNCSSWIAENCQMGLNSWQLMEPVSDGAFSFVSLIPTDSMFHMVSSNEKQLRYYFDIYSDANWSLYWSDSKEGKFPGETDVSVVVSSVNGTALSGSMDSGMTIPFNDILPAGRYYITVSTSDSRGVHCRLKLKKESL